MLLLTKDLGLQSLYKCNYAGTKETISKRVSDILAIFRFTRTFTLQHHSILVTYLKKRNLSTISCAAHAATYQCNQVCHSCWETRGYEVSPAKATSLTLL